MTNQAVNWRNRIIGYANVHPSMLEPNLRNWRLHPDEQQRALLDVLVNVGVVQNVVANSNTMTFTPVDADETGDDIVDFVRTDTEPPTLEHVRISMPHMVDGHLRLKMALEHNQSSLPVTFNDLTEEEENLILATLDPLASLAKIDSSKLRDLHEVLQVEGEALQTMLADLADQAQLYTSAFTPVETDAAYAKNPYEEKTYYIRKQVTAMFGMPEYALFNDSIKQLGKHYDTNALSEILLLTVQDAAKTIPEPTVGPRREKVKTIKAADVKDAEIVVPEQRGRRVGRPPKEAVAEVKTAAEEPKDLVMDESEAIPELL